MRGQSLSFLVIVTVVAACAERSPSRRQRIDDEKEAAPAAASSSVTPANAAELARQSLQEHLRLRVERGETQLSLVAGRGGLSSVDTPAEPAATGSRPGVAMGSTTVSGRLPPEVIQRIVRQNFGRFRLCYENGLRKDPKLAGRVDVRFTIGKDGSVSAASATGTMPDKGVEACVTKAFFGLSFPSPEGGVVVVTYPISFTPGS